MINLPVKAALKFQSFILYEAIGAIWSSLALPDQWQTWLGVEQCSAFIDI